jgi:hypothetical protein
VWLRNRPISHRQFCLLGGVCVGGGGVAYKQRHLYIHENHINNLFGSPQYLDGVSSVECFDDLTPNGLEPLLHHHRVRPIILHQQCYRALDAHPRGFHLGQVRIEVFAVDYDAHRFRERFFWGAKGYLRVRGWTAARNREPEGCAPVDHGVAADFAGEEGNELGDIS